MILLSLPLFLYTQAAVEDLNSQVASLPELQETQTRLENEKIMSEERVAQLQEEVEALRDCWDGEREKILREEQRKREECKRQAQEEAKVREAFLKWCD